MNGNLRVLLWWVAPALAFVRAAGHRDRLGRPAAQAAGGAPGDRTQAGRAGAAARIPGRRRRRQPERDGRPHAVQSDPPPGAAGDGKRRRRKESAKRPIRPDRHDAGGGPQYRVSEGSRRRQGAHGAQGRQDQRDAGGRRAARPGAIHAWRRVRGADAQSRAGPEDYGRSRAADRSAPRRRRRAAVPPPGAPLQRRPHRGAAVGEGQQPAAAPDRAAARAPRPSGGRRSGCDRRSRSGATNARRRRATRRPMPGARSINVCSAATQRTK